MSKTKKTLRSRGKGLCNRGRNCLTGNGARGGAGNAGSQTHKFHNYLLTARKIKKGRKVTCFRDLDSKLEALRKKKLIVQTGIEGNLKTFKATPKFYEVYSKILSQGELSFKLVLNPKKIKLTKKSTLKLL